VEPTQYSFTTGAGMRRSDPRAAVAARGRGDDAQAVGATVGARSLTALSWRCVRAPHAGSICHMECRHIVLGRLFDWRGAFKMHVHDVIVQFHSTRSIARARYSWAVRSAFIRSSLRLRDRIRGRSSACCKLIAPSSPSFWRHARTNLASMAVMKPSATPRRSA
jgi:hypothetical protein